MNYPNIICKSDKYLEYAEKLKEKLNTEIIDAAEHSDSVYIVFDESGMKLVMGEIYIEASFNEIAARIRKENISTEVLCKAAKIKSRDDILVFDATAGLGEDSFVLAYAGFNVVMYENNPVIASMLEFAIENGKESGLRNVLSRVALIEKNSIEAMSEYGKKPDVIYLDPMFPERQKSALVGKKFQILQKLEMPCCNECELLNAAAECRPEKIVVKRPAKGNYLAGRKPTFSLSGKSIRYDCIVMPQNKSK